jgi:glycosyltransferase involved in cell wall biosynthesis
MELITCGSLGVERSRPLHVYEFNEKDDLAIMNVLLASPWPLEFRGGVTVVLRMLGDGLNKTGAQVTYLLPTHGRKVEKFKDQNNASYRVPMRLPRIPAHPWRGWIAFFLFFPVTCARLARILVRHRTDIVNAHYFSEHWLYFLFLRRFMRFRLVVSVHGTDLEGPDGTRNLKTLERWHRQIDGMVFCSEASKRQTIGRQSRLFAKTKVILNAIDVNALPRPIPASERGDYIVCSGHLQEHKGQDILLRAFAEIADDFPHLGLELVGDGPMRDQLEALIQDPKLNGRVTLRGGLPREAALPIMQKAILTCVPSRRETFGLVLLESMAMEVPIVATRVGGIPEVVRDGTEALLSPSEDHKHLAQAIRRLLKDSQLRADLIKCARVRLFETFTSERFTRDYRCYLESLVGSNSNKQAIKRGI